ncbi:hypothetical protein ACL2XP_12625 [Sodalis sp. RH21]|uniref:hypothetical protein n=1 Tax=unclassified Sodalis (in: enterobacteria) TaxID=2636512 RepID=UPI0039B39994
MIAELYIVIVQLSDRQAELPVKPGQRAGEPPRHKGQTRRRDPKKTRHIKNIAQGNGVVFSKHGDNGTKHVDCRRLAVKITAGSCHCFVVGVEVDKAPDVLDALVQALGFMPRGNGNRVRQARFYGLYQALEARIYRLRQRYRGAALIAPVMMIFCAFQVNAKVIDHRRKERNMATTEISPAAAIEWLA